MRESEGNREGNKDQEGGLFGIRKFMSHIADPENEQACELNCDCVWKSGAGNREWET